MYLIQSQFSYSFRGYLLSKYLKQHQQGPIFPADSIDIFFDIPPSYQRNALGHIPSTRFGEDTIKNNAFYSVYQ